MTVQSEQFEVVTDPDNPNALKITKRAPLLMPQTMVVPIAVVLQIAGQLLVTRYGAPQPAVAPARPNVELL